MIRLLGGALVTGSCLWLGWSRWRWYLGRSTVLSGFGHALARMEAELSGRETDTAALLDLLARGEDRASAVFRRCRAALDRLEEKPFAQIWSEALEEEGLPLTREELALLDRVGQVLGRYEGRTQAKLLSGLRREIAQRLGEAREESRQRGKVSLILGLALGLTLTLLLN